MEMMYKTFATPYRGTVTIFYGFIIRILPFLSPYFWVKSRGFRKNIFIFMGLTYTFTGKVQVFTRAEVSL